MSSPILEAAAVSVGTTAGGTLLASPSPSGERAIVIYNNDASTTIYVGPYGVTSSSGMPVAAGRDLTVVSGAAVYAIAASGSVNVRVLRNR